MEAGHQADLLILKLNTRMAVSLPLAVLISKSSRDKFELMRSLSFEEEYK